MKDHYLFTDIEPCFMCAMALVHSRISRLYFKRENVIDGAIVEVKLHQLKNLNH
jgi:tRNA-specific adenosine deaminase 3